VDSNLVVSSMARQSRLPVRTFCAGFGEKAALAGVRDERELAAEAARAYGAEHEEIRLDASSAEGLLPELARRMQEPLADPSCIPTYLICRAARKRVTVALTGDGGDEPFGGYSFRYLPFLLERRIRAAAPGFLMSPAAPAFRMLAGLWPHGDGLPRFLRLKTLFRNLGSDPVAAFYLDQSLLGLGQEALAPSLRKAGNPALEHMRALHGGYHASDPLTRMLYVDARLYMCENVLVKADRMSMANSLELRSPLLDQDLVAFAFSLPDRFKIRDGECKFLLRRLAAERTPPRLLDQPKTGFSLPYDAYLRGPWKPLFESRVFGGGGSAAACGEFLDLADVKRKWEAFLGGRNAPLRFLWAVFTFALWHAEAAEGRRTAA
jgi:asparagine synthase (glutamine-hydrolysing)